MNVFNRDGAGAQLRLWFQTDFLWWRSLVNLPPNLPHLKDVDDCLPDPNGEETASVSLVSEGSRGSPATQSLYGAQSTPGVILHEPPEAKDLDQNRGDKHEEQGQSGPEVVLLMVVIDGQP